MENGLLERHSGKFFPAETRAQIIASEAIRAMLKRNHRRFGNVCCGCGLDDLEYFPVVPSLLPGQKKLFNAVRGDIREHRIGCFLSSTFDESPTQYIRSPKIFAPVAEEANIGFEVLAEKNGHAAVRRAYETYSEYCRRVLSRGVAAAFVAKNYGRDVAINPTAVETLVAIDQTIRDMPFSNGVDGYATALRWRCHLRFGLVYDPVVRRGEPEENVTVFWFENGSFSLGQVSVAPLAMIPAVADLRIYRHHQLPPYFVLGIQDARGCMQRIYFHQLAVEEGHFIPVESGAEAEYAVELVKKDLAIIKPIRMEDTETLLIQLGINLLEPPNWPYRPDFLIPSIFMGEDFLFIRELRGFKECVDDDYDRRIAVKKIVSDTMKATVRVHYKEIDGTEKSCPQSVGDPSVWPQTRVTIGPRPE